MLLTHYRFCDVATGNGVYIYFKFMHCVQLVNYT